MLMDIDLSECGMYNYVGEKLQATADNFNTQCRKWCVELTGNY